MLWNVQAFGLVGYMFCFFHLMVKWLLGLVDLVPIIMLQSSHVCCSCVSSVQRSGLFLWLTVTSPPWVTFISTPRKYSRDDWSVKAADQEAVPPEWTLLNERSRSWEEPSSCLELSLSILFQWFAGWGHGLSVRVSTRPAMFSVSNSCSSHGRVLGLLANNFHTVLLLCLLIS